MKYVVTAYDILDHKKAKRIKMLEKRVKELTNLLAGKGIMYNGALAKYEACKSELTRLYQALFNIDSITKDNA